VDSYTPQLSGGVAHQLSERAIGLEDFARCRIAQEDAFRGLFDHRPVALFALFQRIPDPLALGDVLDDNDEVLRLSRGIAPERRGQVDPNRRAVLAQVPLFHRVSRDLSGEQLVLVLEVGLQVVGVGDVLKRSF
jgi:hypothetical protein